MLTPLTRAISQLDDPAILRILAGSFLLSSACFLLSCAATAYGLHHLLDRLHWISWLAATLGGLAVLVSGLWLFLPACVVIASLFMEPICRAVERRWYPGLPVPSGAGLAAQLWDSVLVALLVMVMSGVSLILALLLPGLGLIIGWLITAWALGRGLFMTVAMRRMDRQAAGSLYRKNRAVVLAQGAALALAGSFPLINLLVPFLGSACMVHVVMQQRAVPLQRWANG